MKFFSACGVHLRVLSVFIEYGCGAYQEQKLKFFVIQVKSTLFCGGRVISKVGGGDHDSLRGFISRSVRE